MYYEARKKALNNGMVYHLAAILRRRGKVVRIGINSSKTHPRFRRQYPDGTWGAHMHAEMDALRFAMPGDELEVLRWKKEDYTFGMAKPCGWCMKHIVESGISKVVYTDYDGTRQEMKVMKNET